MLSVLSSFLLQAQPQHSQEILQMLKEIHMMLLEILYTSKEIYVCLYTIMPLASYALRFPEIVSECGEQIVHLIRKIIAPVGGL